MTILRYIVFTEINLLIFFMVISIGVAGKTFISIGVGIVIGLSPFRDSKLAKILIAITGG